MSVAAARFAGVATAHRMSFESQAVRSQRPVSPSRPKSIAPVLVSAALALAVLVPGAVRAQSIDKPYDDKLLRLSEILGAIHYLRELCGANDGQQWRERMTELVNAEGASALRKARLSRSFNQGYQSYSRTYKVCTPTAQTAIARFMTEGAQIADGLVKSVP